ncbi:MAG: hypothetical protein P9L94_16185 [Candidatus Hinthialibacter antarcticus]|nr:hypothetical protein [Candidatus Hinthialibacter antarcticus]
MGYLFARAMEIFAPGISVGVALFIAGFLMDSREEDERRGLMGNLFGAVGVMLGLSLALFLSQWVPLFRYLLTPIMWVLIFVSFRLGSLIEMVAMCVLSFLIMKILTAMLIGLA